MYRATDQLPTSADRPDDGMQWYVRKFRLETTEGDALGRIDLPAVRGRKWLIVVAATAVGLSILLALLTVALTALRPPM